MDNKRNYRYEYKFVFKETDLCYMRSLIKSHPYLFINKYPCRVVNNIYFDTNNYDCYLDNLCGITARNKLRFRWYGDVFLNILGQVELKCKKDLVSWKIIERINKKIDFTTMNWREIIEIISNSLSGILKIKLAKLCRPVLFNRYQREYFETYDGDFRVTLDFNQRFFIQRSNLKPNITNKSSMMETAIMEIKCDRAKRFQLEKLTNFFPVSLSQSSKYCKGVSSGFY